MTIRRFDSATQQHLQELLSLVNLSNPAAVILGGSYSTGEQCKLRISDNWYYLSDFDVFIVCNSLPPPAVVREVYRSTIRLATSIDQHNPYFHIGLKFRTLGDIETEARTIYYWELIENGINVTNESFRLPTPEGGIFASIGEPGSKQLAEYLFQCAIARVWCNILFFPSQVLSQASFAHDLWYSYFVSRGAMDWITFNLLKRGIWASTYASRFSQFHDSPLGLSDELPLLKTCYKVRTGKSVVPMRRLASDVIGLSVSQLETYRKESGSNAESEFLYAMSLALGIMLRDITQTSTISLALDSASENLQLLVTIPNLPNGTVLERWSALRRSYSDFRLQRSSTDRMDHYENTERILKIGSLYR